MKQTADKTLFRKELKQIAARLKSENEALLRLVRELGNSATSHDEIRKNRKSKTKSLWKNGF